MNISKNLSLINTAIIETAQMHSKDPATIKLVAVSKRHQVTAITEAIDSGQTRFGENYIQEAAEKVSHFQDNIKFHFIGHIQSNKAKQAAELFDMIETVDRFKLAKALNKHLEKIDRKIDILIQVNIGNDPNKSGVLPEKAEELLQLIIPFKRLRPLGLMTIPPFETDNEKTRVHFRNLRLLGKRLADQQLFYNNDIFELSMGMSHDFKVAIEEGATIIRVGTAIFGARPDTIHKGAKTC